MLSGGPQHLIKDKFVVVKMPLNAHIQDEVKLDELLYISSLFCVKDRIIYTILTARETIRLILQRPWIKLFWPSFKTTCVFARMTSSIS